MSTPAVGPLPSPPATAPSLHPLRALLPRVSRTFALGIRLLPRALSDQVTIAYLICRVADTIEDSAALPAELRHALLHRFAGWLDAPPDAVTELVSHFAPAQSADEELVQEVSRVLTAFHAFPGHVQQAIRGPAREMCEGMAAWAVSGRPGEPAPPPADLAELERYCWYVAGTVGWLLTDLFRLADPRWSPERYTTLRRHSHGFGVGLQLTNVIRDIGEDRGRGVSFVPADLCAQLDVAPDQLFTPPHEAATRAVLGTLSARAHDQLREGLAYCITLPRASWRIRLFCLIPLLLATRTLARIAAEPAYRAGWVRVKLSRREVYQTLALAALVAPSNALSRLAFRWLGPTGGTAHA